MIMSFSNLGSVNIQTLIYLRIQNASFMLSLNIFQNSIICNLDSFSKITYSIPVLKLSKNSKKKMVLELLCFEIRFYLDFCNQFLLTVVNFVCVTLISQWKKYCNPFKLLYTWYLIKDSQLHNDRIFKISVFGQNGINVIRLASLM